MLDGRSGETDLHICHSVALPDYSKQNGESPGTSHEETDKRPLLALRLAGRLGFPVSKCCSSKCKQAKPQAETCGNYYEASPGPGQFPRCLSGSYVWMLSPCNFVSTQATTKAVAIKRSASPAEQALLLPDVFEVSIDPARGVKLAKLRFPIRKLRKLERATRAERAA